MLVPLGASSDAQAPSPILQPRVVPEVLSGLKRQAEVARHHKLKPELIARWKDIALEGLESLFQGEGQRGPDEDRIAELERMVGRLTMELEVAKATHPSADGGRRTAATTSRATRTWSWTWR